MNDVSEMQRGFRGIWIPREIWLHEGLSWLEKILAAEIDSLDNEELGGCTASNAYLAEKFGVSERHITRAIKKLTEHELTTVLKNNGRKTWRAGYSRLKWIGKKKSCGGPDLTKKSGKTRQKCRSTPDQNVGHKSKSKTKSKLSSKEDKNACARKISSHPTNPKLAHPAAEDTTPPKPKRKKAAAKPNLDLKPFGDDGLIKLSDEQLAKLEADFGKREVADMIDTMDDWLGANGKTYVCYYKALRNWFRRESKQSVQSSNIQPGQSSARKHPGCTVDESRAWTREPDCIVTEDDEEVSIGLEEMLRLTEEWERKQKEKNK